jgi:hypothetical protein
VDHVEHGVTRCGLLVIAGRQVKIIFDALREDIAAEKLFGDAAAFGKASERGRCGSSFG